MKYIRTLPVLLVMMTACENPITFVWDIRVETDSAEYVSTSTVTVTIRNASEYPVDIRRCGMIPYFSIQRQDGIAWQTVYTVDCPGAELYTPLPVNQSVMFPVDLSVLSGSAEIPGTYRIETIVYPIDDRTFRLPSNMRISNLFTVTQTDEGETDI
jgi:hypothetical protein